MRLHTNRGGTVTLEYRVAQQCHWAADHRHSAVMLAAAIILTLICTHAVLAADALLSWDPNVETDLAGYRIHYGATQGSYPTVIDVGQVTIYTITGLGPGTYYFVVTAYDTTGTESAFSNQVSTVITDTTPPVLSVIAASGITSANATITWATDEPATGLVEYGTSTGYGLQTTENIALATVHNQELTGLQALTTYHYRVLSRDAAGNLAVSGDRTLTTPALPDTTAPVISGVSAGSVTGSGATVTWTTNEAATTQIQYGTTTAYGSTTGLNGALLTAHSQSLAGLTSATTYHFRVLSRDAAGNLATSGDFTMRTLAPVDTTAPIISNISAGAVTLTGATVSWTTNEAATTQVQYGLTATYGFSTSLNSALVTTHSQGLAGLTAATTYHFRVLSRDAAGNISTSADQTFRTALATTHVDFTYPTNLALLAGGWSYLAKTASGASRNTEQTGSLATNYNQTIHSGTIRIPLGGGEIWQTLNNSQNTLFRTLPSDWTSIRLKIAAFSPAADYQQVALLAYQDDDNYVNVQRNYNSASGGAVIGFFREVGSVTTRTDRRPLANAGNLILRLDRDQGTNTFRAFYSTNNGSTWVQLTGAPTQALTNPRLAIQVGANAAGTLPTADLAWVEILQ